jgi:DeoR/GlpR family transcriptional regulator of sugar metabolism
MLALARTPVLLADHTKFDRIAPVRVANLDKVTHLIVDREPEGAMARALATLTAELLIAGREEG